MSETEKPKSLYAESGVNIDEQDKAIHNIKNIVKTTFTDNVVTGIGSFGAMYSVPEGYKQPILVSSSDGIGTRELLGDNTSPVRWSVLGIFDP